MRHLPPASPVPAYLRRLLLADAEADREQLVRRYRLSTALMDVLVEAGLASAGADPAVRAAFPMANDLAVLLLRDHLAGVLGVDPRSGEGDDPMGRPGPGAARRRPGRRAGPAGRGRRLFVFVAI